MESSSRIPGRRFLELASLIAMSGCWPPTGDAIGAGQFTPTAPDPHLGALRREFSGKKVWLFGQPDLLMNNRIDPVRIRAIKSLGRRAWVSYQGNEVGYPEHRGFWGEHPLEVEIIATFKDEDAQSVRHDRVLWNGKPEKERPVICEVVVADSNHFRLLFSKKRPIPTKMPPKFRKALYEGHAINGMTKPMVKLLYGPPDWDDSTPARAYRDDRWGYTMATAISDTYLFKNGRLVGHAGSSLP